MTDGRSGELFIRNLLMPAFRKQWTRYFHVEWETLGRDQRFDSDFLIASMMVTIARLDTDDGIAVWSALATRSLGVGVMRTLADLRARATNLES